VLVICHAIIWEVGITLKKRRYVMKKLFLISTVIAFVITSATVHAQVVAPLGQSNFVLKFDYIVFTDGFFDNQGNGLYIGLEGYGKIASNFYLGGEVGQAGNIAIVGEDINFVPIEVNIKYAREFAHNLVVDFGAGFSYSYAELKQSFYFGTAPEERNDWLFGGQIFADLSYKINWFSIGLDVKYQITQSFKDEDLDLSNFRLGLHIGIIF
jgi:hypothetical protein